MKREAPSLSPTPGQSGLGQTLLYAAGLACVVLLTVFQALHLWRYDFRAPINYSGDALVILLYIKGLLQDGWPTTITGLSAPFSYPGAAFPMLTSTDWLVMKFLSLFTDDPGHLANSFWLVSMVLCAWSSAYAAWQLGLSRPLSFACGILYALLPYAFLRNIAHLNLVYYLVPLLCLLAVRIAGSGQGIRNPGQAAAVGLAACVAQGFNYVYYSFFAALLFGVAALLACTRDELRRLRLPALAIALLATSTAINLLPGIMSWREDGKPPEMAYKSAAETEYYGLKIRRLVAPHPDNPVPPLAHYARRDQRAGFPNENENMFARLGLVGASGFVLMVIAALRRTAGHPLAQPAAAISALGMATVLLATVGGFGTILNLLTVPDIRAYNRLSVFLAFFCIVAAGLWFRDRLLSLTSGARIFACVAAAAFVVLSLYDQLLDGTPLVQAQHASLRQTEQDRAIVRHLEHAYPEGAVVLQLPFSGYPISYQFHNMQSYDHARPYLWSTNSRWSWPSFSPRHYAWQEKMRGLQGQDLVEAAIFSGFNAIWIDRFAYEDQGQSLLSGLHLPQVEQIDVGHRRFAVLDLRARARELKKTIGEAAFNRRSDEALHGDSVVVAWGDGFYAQENNPDGKEFRWATRNAYIEIRNFAGRRTTVCASFEIAALGHGTVRIDGADGAQQVTVSTVPQRLHLPVVLGPGKTRKLRFSTDMERVAVPGDARQMYFHLMDLRTPVMASANGAPVPCGANDR